MAGAIIWPGDIERALQGFSDRHRWVLPVGKARGNENTAGQVEAIGDTLKETLVTRLGDQELDIGVGNVPRQVFVATGVIKAHQRRSCQPGAAQRKNVVGRVVEEHRDMGWAVRIKPSTVHLGKSLSFGEELYMSPDVITETEGGTRCVPRVAAVASQKSGDVPGRKRNLVQGRGEHDGLRHLTRPLATR
jgi:hypothetical protein